MTATRLPNQCQDLSHIRAEVNRIDREIIAMVAQRTAYAEAAVAFKASEADIRAPDHLPAFFAERRRQAREAGLSEAMVETIFRAITERSVELQLAKWRVR